MKTYTLQNDHLQVEYLPEPLRIMGFTPAGGTNMLADLNDLPIVPTPHGDFYFRGGHRLWHAPESMPRTYIPDTPVTVTSLPGGVLLESQTEPGTGIRKQMEIHISSDRPALTITHILINDGLWSVELAPWAITQFRLGGTVILPLPVGNTDPAGLLHNRQFSLWPYARFHDPRLKLGDEYILFNADALLPPFKIGYFNPNGWIAYWLDGVLFRKTFDAQKNLPYPDNNCNAEMYCNNRFVELESLGPLTRLNPGASTTHVEKWEILKEIDFLPEEIREQLRP
ncbi:MAG: hypothetical protein ACM3XO_03955 [Bacteroidota bacterium]